MKWLKGYIECRLCGGSLERFLNMCRHHGIHIWKLQQTEEIHMCMYAKDFVLLIPLCAKSAVHPHLVRKRGLPFQILKMWRNWTFYSGFLFFLVTLFVLSSYLWEITYSGQRSFSRETLSADVEGMGVYPGMKRIRLDCDAIEKKLREIHPEISWVSAEEIGSVLKISIKEGKENVEHEKTGTPCHLIAPYDGTVQEISVSRGTAKVKKGKKVKKGDILISGLVPVTDDSDQVREYMTVAAKGEISILVRQEFSEPISTHYKKKEYTGNNVTQWMLQWQNRRISLKNPFKRLDNSAEYDIITEICVDRTIHPLPISVLAERREFRNYKEIDAVYTKDELRKEGMRRYQRRMEQLTEDDMELSSHRAVMKQQDEKTWLLQGEISFLCKKMEARAVSEEEARVNQPEPSPEEFGNSAG